MGPVADLRVSYRRAKKDHYALLSTRKHKTYDHLCVLQHHLIVGLGQLILGEDVLRRLRQTSSNAAGSAEQPKGCC